MTKIAFQTYGCRLNQSETSVVEHSFRTQGYTIVDIDSCPDIVVINTCTVTENGDSDTKHLVYRLSHQNPSVRIALIGCQAQIQKNRLTSLPNVSWIVGNARKMDLASIIQNTHSDDTIQVITPSIPRENFVIPIIEEDFQRRRANLKIQDGCDFFCSFCEIPFARGRARSRVFDDIIRQAEILVQNGHKEIVLTGINLGTYGHETKTLSDILDGLENLNGLERVRISSIEPTTVSFELIERMGTTKLCRYLHIPLQSGSNNVLAKMQRKYTTEFFSAFINKIHEFNPSICIGTDVIVGFPGESAQDFEQTCQLIKNLPLAYAHVFSYSDRTRNKSRLFTPKIPATTIQQRSKILRGMSLRKNQMFIRRFLGTTSSVLFEEKKSQFWYGLTDNYLRTMVETEKYLHNQTLPVQIKDVNGSCAIGVLA